MVTMFGMSDIGPWALTDPAAQSSDVVLRMLARNSVSEKLAEDIDLSVRDIIGNAYEIAKNHVRNNREAIDKLVDVLLEKESRKPSQEMSSGQSCPNSSKFLQLRLEQLLYGRLVQLYSYFCLIKINENYEMRENKGKVD
jgi:hypothetical protein